MSYQLNLDVIRDKFKFETSIKHNPKMETELLPYNTKFKDTQYNFKEVVGQFIRLVGHKSLHEVVNIDDLLNNVLDKIEFQQISQRSEFKQMIKTMFLDERNQLYLFHPEILYYINTVDSENKKLALFLYNVLWNQEEVWNIKKMEESNSYDLLSNLLFSSLPSLNQSSDNLKSYAVMIPEISELFIQDFKWLATKHELFTLQVEKIISYYYFFYITQFVMRNELMFGKVDRAIKPIYFTFEGEEKLSKTRISYEYGWRSLEKIVNRIFSHVNFLKMLNISNEDSKEFYSYQDIAYWVKKMTVDEKTDLEQKLDMLIEEYKNKSTGDIKWDLMGSIQSPYDETVLNKMLLLFNLIDYQFNHSTRNKNYNEYKQWFVHFCQKTFLKSRGRSGKMLILDTDYLLFITKLIIKNESKVRLRKLFEEFEKRGIIFDRDTQSAIVDYFEKLNLLEKKSDSGDAIYVKAFL